MMRFDQDRLASPTGDAAPRSLDMTRLVPVALLASTLLVAMFVVLDIGGVLGGTVRLVYLVGAPGLAITIPMGAMSQEVRLLVAVAAGAGTVTLVSLLLLAVGLWSGTLGFLVLAAVVVTLAGSELRRSGDRSADLNEPPHSAHDLAFDDHRAGPGDPSRNGGTGP